ncbi:hypothetical protein EC973_002142 [Apophysomyces ossiformis]|uniref:Pyridoxamine 5'-phosphate oxidase Alr4036 family FMN-binding domain-containing protein n=1 Tax=Apophysomyces ossiformis TaxID=679940 RepID=A0A8H7BN89_9FUNG|nr:hypothetical protein EC973_002142 [Apophysomyces ossiformis]
MSDSTHHSDSKVNASPAWKKVILSRVAANVEKVGNGASYISLATVRSDNTPSNTTVAFTGFAGEDPSEETGWQSDLLTITCDKRSSKMVDIASNASFEANWILSGTNDQFRIRGRVHVIAQDIEPASELDSHIARKKIHLFKGDKDEDVDFGDKLSQATKSFLNRIKSRLHHPGKKRKFDWEAERLRQWHRLSNDARAHYTWPTSGALKDEELPRIESLEIGDSNEEGWFVHEDKDKQALLERGYENFAVCFLEVDEVEHYDAEVNERLLYKKQEKDWAKSSLNI